MSAVLMMTACQEQSTRKGAAQLLGRGMLAEVAHVVEVETVRGRGSTDPDRPYRRATVLHDARVDCEDRRRVDATCGATVEVYASTRAAADRVRELRGPQGVVRRGVYVLHVSPELDRDAVRQYRQAFLGLAVAR